MCRQGSVDPAGQAIFFDPPMVADIGVQGGEIRARASRRQDAGATGIINAAGIFFREFSQLAAANGECAL